MPESSSTTRPLIDVRDLAVEFATEHGTVRPVDGVSFSVRPGRTLGIVGESGCGKSVTSLAIMGLLAQPPARVAGGEILFDGQDLLSLAPEALRDLRGDQLSMIFQEPMSALNPSFTIGDQIGEVLVRHRGLKRAAAVDEAIQLLRLVGIPSPERRVHDYPHRLSGGMRQRVVIAMALACRPKLLIADEPTTALDVTIQAQILDLLRRLRDETGTAIILITHDLGVIAELADEVAVMYAGRVVERAPVDRLFADPQHPYTIGLLGAVARLDRTVERLAVIEGTVPSPLSAPPGCRFNPRCPFAIERCRAEAPPLAVVAPGHQAACWRAPLEDAA
ncbi:ABC transporter ATP-binding protein [Aliidongia dinghuensis]|uniref:ABC transporter ATP-binding protein n=1 Tax=Aliidongia dinghuensis TaxID=1867774 RepID=A0A8J2YYJ2_9PROT|nr:ABC transporter ATP-binding protein [Aliidongia dinghuensis]